MVAKFPLNMVYWLTSRKASHLLFGYNEGLEKSWWQQKEGKEVEKGGPYRMGRNQKADRLRWGLWLLPWAGRPVEGCEWRRDRAVLARA